jgi:hypothetical protein
VAGVGVIEDRETGMTPMAKRLTRSLDDKMLCGVAAHLLLCQLMPLETSGRPA